MPGKRFQEAQQLDPSFAMAYWGEAMGQLASRYPDDLEGLR